MTGHSDDSGTIWDIPEHYGAGPHSGVISHSNVAQNLSARTDDHSIANRGMSLELFLAGTAERSALIQRDVIADDRSFSDDDTHAMINEQTTPNLRSRMNLDPGQPPCHL